MTKILKLEAKGFKSFGQKTDIVFGDNFNVVLGPNGSGKSNVLDALCFVLGKSGAKGLRAEKTANLVYNGGKSKQPAKQGEVSIYLDNSEKEFPLQEKVIKISRIVKESGLSSYRINDKKHTREQVLELLGSASIDPNGYNIVLQGDIVRLVDMSLNDRRLIIEEIAGISVYEDKKQKAQRELEKIEANLNDAEIILSERKTYMRELKKERDQAVEYKSLQDRLKSLRATMVTLDVTIKQEKIDELNKSTASYSKKVSEIQTNINDLKKQVDEYKKEVSEINKEIEEKGEKNQVALHREVEQLKVDIATAQTKIDGFSNEIERVREQKMQYQQSLDELDKRIGSTAKEISSKEKSLKDNIALQKDLEKKISDFKKKNNLDNASAIDEQISELDHKAEELEKEMYELRSKQQEFIREKDRLEIQINTTDEKIQKVLSVSKEHAQELERLRKLKQQFKQDSVELQKCLTQDASFASQIVTARGKLSVIEEELAKNRVRQATISERIGGNLAVKEIISNKNKFDGIYGTVADLATVDRKYALALDVAAGNRIQSIVVKDDKVAADCIAFLKNTRSGVATFLPLNKIKPSEKRNISDTKGVIGFATDLIKFDAKFKNVFSYIFGTTLVVENISVARRIGIGTVRMVSLEGDLVELSGAMRGGFVKKTQGSGFQEAKVTENIDQLEKELSDYQSLVSRITADRKKNQDSIDSLRESKAELEGEIIKTEKSLHLESGDLDISKKLKAEFTESLKKVDSELSAVSRVVSEKNRVLAQLKMDKQKLRNQIMDIRNPTKLAELTTFQEKLQSLKSEAIRLESEISSRVDDRSSKEKETIASLIHKQKGEEDSIKQKINEIKETISVMKDSLKDKEKSEKEFYAKFKQSFNARNKLQEKIEKDESKIIRLEEEARAIEHKDTAVALELARYKTEMHALQEELQKYEGVEILKQKDPDSLKKELWSAEQRFNRIGNVNLKALEVYDRVESEFNKLVSKKEVLISEREKILVMINEIDTKKQELFLKVFTVVNENFQKIFQLLSSKGKATMELESPKSPFDGGVRIKVLLKGKKYMDIRSLSGGEKTLTALAFLFAVQEHNPASFYIFDEVDAALDKRNSEKLASLVQSYAKRAQYIVITHNDGIISAADTLYGVSMDEHNMSKVVSLRV